MNNLVCARLVSRSVQGCKTKGHPVCKRLPLIDHSYVKSRKFSCVSSVVSYHDPWDGHRQKWTKPSCNLVNKLQTRSFMEDGIRATLYSTDKNFILAYTKQFLETFHDTTGLPWWGTILLCTVVLKSCTNLPLAIVCERVRVRHKKMQPEFMMRMKKVSYKMSIGKKYNPAFFDGTSENAELKKRKKEIARELYKKHKCHPLRMSPILCQIPIWISVSITLRVMSGVSLPGNESISPAAGMTTEGLFWFQNLLECDPFCGLPLVFLLLNLAIVQINPALNMENDKEEKSPDDTYSQVQDSNKEDTNPTFQKIAKIGRNCLRVYMVFLAGVCSCMPSSIAFYWTISSLFGLGQNLLFTNKKFRKTFLESKSNTN